MTSEKIPLQSWMTDPRTQAIFSALREGDFSARFVGGCVRDTLLGRKIRDIDIASDAPPDDIIRCLQNANIRTIPTGIEHGTVTAVIGGASFEITTLRRDVETDGRHAKVTFTDDWDGDAARRDLTINSISLEIDGTLHDPFGGRADLKAGRIRFVGNPQDRIVEDVLRLLRYFRFQAHYGTPPPDQEALAACRLLAPRLSKLSGERVRSELLKLLEAPDPAPTLRLMAEAKILEHFLPEATEIWCLSRLLTFESDVKTSIDPIRRLAALLTVDGDSLKGVANRLRFSNAERDQLLMAATITVSPKFSAVERRRILYRLGSTSVRELVLLGWARDIAGLYWRPFLQEVDCWTPKTLPLTGNDVLSRGISPGATVGKLLRVVEAWWIDGNFVADRDECLDRLDEELNAGFE